MGTLRWTGLEGAQAQVDTVVVSGSPGSGNTYTVTINSKNVTYTWQTGDTNATITTALIGLLNASTYPEFAEITWSATVGSTTSITATCKTPGKPFTETSSSSGGTMTSSTIVANAGPSCIDHPLNYSTNALPTSGDDLYLDTSAPPMLYDGGGITGVTLSTFNITLGFTGQQIGLSVINYDDQSNPYIEYRNAGTGGQGGPAYLASLPATTVNIGFGAQGTPLTRFLYDCGSVQTTINIFALGAPTDPHVNEAMWFRGTNADNVIRIYQGTLAVGNDAEDTTEFATLVQGYETAQTSDTFVRVGPAATATTIIKSGGTLELNVGCTTLMNYEGDVLFQGAGAITTVTMISQAGGATFYYRSSGTITTFNMGAVTLDSAPDVAHTITTVNAITPGSTITDPGQSLTLTNGIVLASGVQTTDVTLNMGYGRTIKVT
jgi:hypothetical protein